MAQTRREVEVCDFCSVPMPSAHRHLLELKTRKIVCVCDACALRFEGVIGRWKLIPRDVRSLPGFKINDSQWEALSLPINLAFIFRSTAEQRAIAMYPSPAGATESLLPLSSWEELVAANPVLARLDFDVEALLVNRIDSWPAAKGIGVASNAGEQPREYWIAPIDICFELVGLIRMHWRGLSGGDQVWREIHQFFGQIKASAKPAQLQPEAIHA